MQYFLGIVNCLLRSKRQSAEEFPPALSLELKQRSVALLYVCKHVTTITIVTSRAIPRRRYHAIKLFVSPGGSSSCVSEPQRSSVPYASSVDALSPLICLSMQKIEKERKTQEFRRSCFHDDNELSTIQGKDETRTFTMVERLLIDY